MGKHKTQIKRNTQSGEQENMTNNKKEQENIKHNKNNKQRTIMSKTATDKMRQIKNK